MNPQPPTRIAGYIIKVAVRTLPRSHRHRYDREFTADLCCLSKQQQFGYASHVLSRTWALRAALHQLAPTAIEETTMRKYRPLRCRLNLHHLWKHAQTEDGARYMVCSRCGKEHAPVGLGENKIGA
jgi:hypothetical protein